MRYASCPAGLTPRGAPLVDAAAHGAEMRNGGGSDHLRKGRKGDWRDHFSAAQRLRFCEVLRQRLVGSGLEEAFDAGMDDE